MLYENLEKKNNKNNKKIYKNTNNKIKNTSINKNKTQKIKHKFIKSVKFSNPITDNQNHGGDKQMKCSPLVNGKTINKNTCYTKNVLLQIKKEYNNYNKENQIKTNNPEKIWKELKKRFNCTKEDCWLNTIQNEKIKKHIQEYVFAPTHPDEWNHNPNEWLSNIDIFNVLVQYEEKYPNFNFIGPSFIDFASITENKTCVTSELCNFSLIKYIKNKINKIAIVFNLDKHTGPGTHWVSMFIDIQDQFIFYFDSAGTKIPKQIMELVKTIKEQGLKLSKPIQFKFYQNHPFEHQMSNTECGMYSLFFIITMIKNIVEEPTYYEFENSNEKIIFFKKIRITDKYVEKLRKEYFNS